MTPEDIADLALETADEIGAFDYRRAGAGDEIKVPDPVALRGIEASIRKAILQTFEDAMAALCEGCRGNWPYDPQFQRHQIGEANPSCDALLVRRLKDSLEPVAASAP